MERLLDPEDPMDIDRAEAVAKVAQVVVNSAKVEVDFLKQTGHGGTAFMGGAPADRRQLSAVPPIDVTPETPHQQLCQSCQLPDCNEESDRCLVKIQRAQKRAA